jgi:hypothetical protein
MTIIASETIVIEGIAVLKTYIEKIGAVKNIAAINGAQK